MTALPAEPLTAREIEQFGAEFIRLGETIIAQTLTRYGVKRLSYLRKVDRIRLFAELKRTVRK